MPKTVILIALYPGVTQLDFTGPHQVLSRAPNAEVITASLGARDIETDGLVFAWLTDLAKVPACDVLLVPGGYGCAETMLDEAFMAEIRRLGATAKYVTSVCTGSLILAAAGFLAGKRAACHWAWRELLTPFGAIVSEARVERDGNIITGGGVTAGIDFGFVLLAELAGQAHAERVQLGLEYAPDPPFRSGRPELARPEVLAEVRARMAPLVASRAAAAEEAARRLQPA
ncbi:MAG: DJ-1/PfpI family protein [Phenylobacterium sp.]|nr:MAG: DJ-1/PfpI family protein [Phenylobacterium sp.]